MDRSKQRQTKEIAKEEDSHPIHRTSAYHPPEEISCLLAVNGHTPKERSGGQPLLDLSFRGTSAPSHVAFARGDDTGCVMMMASVSKEARGDGQL